ncbi:MAG: glutathione S-transferase, partial [Lachnospiraceae bacterium]
DRRFLLGDFVSEADVELFVSLVRFDAGYSRQLGAVKHRLVDYPNLWGYARDLYQIPAFWQNVDWESIIARVRPEDEKDNYSQNTFYDLVLPHTDLDGLWKTETERAGLSGDPTHPFLLSDNRRFDR